MRDSLLAYAGTLAIFIGLDYLWLGHLARDFYARQLGDLLRHPPRFGVAALFYVGYAAGIVFFAVLPGLRDGSVWPVAARGAALGLLAYGAYDLTNLATIRNWPLAMSLVDMAWGGAVTATAATAGFVLVRFTGSN